MPPAASKVFRRGEVVLALFPNSNLHSAKPRPALVVQADALRTGLPQVVVAMITSRMLILLSSPEGKSSGLLSDSVVMTDNLVTLSEGLISRVIGSLPMDQINAGLRHTLAL